ncbi:MAG: DNA primase [Thermodesulfovibrionales bacterium]|jgi:DNA primase
MKSDYLIEDIKTRIDIVDLISDHVDLKRAGQNFKGLCPFHAEKSPSFMVSPSKQIFHCFGCHKGGDIFTFVMEHEGMSFPEALSLLAERAGVQIDEVRSGEGKGIKDALFGMQRFAAGFFRERLSSSRNAISYLRERGIDEEATEAFGLGYGPREGDSLFKALRREGFSEEQVRTSGLVHFGERGPMDFFRDRIIFPIEDLHGKVIAFGGRLMSDSRTSPKYLNSPDSPIFRKGDCAYGLSHAKKTISQKGYTILVEGYFDVITCHRHGFSHAVAPLGTALTQGHLKRLRKLSTKILLVFDGDPAGIAATKRSLELCYSEGMVAKVLLLPAGEDPDTLIRKEGEEYFRRYLGRAISPVAFLMKNVPNRIDGVRHALRLLSSCPDNLLRDESVRELAYVSGMTELILREELKEMGRSREKGELPPQQEVRKRGPRDAEEILLGIVLSMPDRAADILENLNMDEIEGSAIKEIFLKIKELTLQGEAPSVDRLLDTSEAKTREVITRLSVDPGIDDAHVDENIEDCLRSIALKGLDRRIKAAERQGDEGMLRTLLEEKRKICR